MKTLFLILMLCGSVLAQNDAADTSGEEKGILEEKELAGKVALLGSFRTGNVDTSLFQVSASLMRQWLRDRLTVEASLAYGETEGTTTAASALGRGKWDHYFEKDFYLYGLTEAEWDDVKDLDLRALIGGGVGFGIWRGEKDHQSLDAETGLTFIYEDYSTAASSESDLAVRLAVAFKDVFFDKLLFTQKVECLTPVSDLGDFLLRATTDVSVKVGEAWALRNTLEIEFQGRPAAGSEDLDIRFLIGLEYGF